MHRARIGLGDGVAVTIQRRTGVFDWLLLGPFVGRTAGIAAVGVPSTALAIALGLLLTVLGGRSDDRAGDRLLGHVDICVVDRQHAFEELDGGVLSFDGRPPDGIPVAVDGDGPGWCLHGAGGVVHRQLVVDGASFTLGFRAVRMVWGELGIPRADRLVVGRGVCRRGVRCRGRLLGSVGRYGGDAAVAAVGPDQRLVVHFTVGIDVHPEDVASLDAADAIGGEDLSVLEQVVAGEVGRLVQLDLHVADAAHEAVVFRLWQVGQGPFAGGHA